MNISDKEKEAFTKEGLLIKLSDYDLRVHFNEGLATEVDIRFFKKTKNPLGSHTEKFSLDDVEMLIEDVKDLSDWRHYRRLMKKLN